MISNGMQMIRGNGTRGTFSTKLPRCLRIPRAGLQFCLTFCGAASSTTVPGDPIYPAFVVLLFSKFTMQLLYSALLIKKKWQAWLFVDCCFITFEFKTRRSKLSDSRLKKASTWTFSALIARRGNSCRKLSSEILFAPRNYHIMRNVCLQINPDEDGPR